MRLLLPVVAAVQNPMYRPMVQNHYQQCSLTQTRPVRWCYCQIQTTLEQQGLPHQNYYCQSLPPQLLPAPIQTSSLLPEAVVVVEEEEHQTDWDPLVVVVARTAHLAAIQVLLLLVVAMELVDLVKEGSTTY